MFDVLFMFRMVRFAQNPNVQFCLALTLELMANNKMPMRNAENEYVTFELL